MKTIVFEDHGQDFLEWDIDGKGVIVDCRPFQRSFWGGKRVTNHRALAVGGHARVRLWVGLTTIKYPLVDVVTLRPTQ